MRAKTLGRGVVSVPVDLSKAGSEAWFLLRSDAHHDNAHCDRKMELRHLEQALERDAGIIDNGDLFCVMNGKWDRRSDQTQLRPEHRGNNYLDLVVEEAAEFYAPFAKNFILLGHGNHETSILQHHQVDMTQRIAALLNANHGGDVRCHGYHGWVKFKTTRGNQRRCINLYRHHGYGGASPVTKGVIRTARMAVYLPDAHIVVTGHDHNEWLFHIARHRISDLGRTYQDEQVHLDIPGYKRACSMGDSNWEAVKGFAPQTCGAAWLRFFRRAGEGRIDVEYEITRAT
jgi:hypothetical protein